jgi:pentalenene oxygenase
VEIRLGPRPAFVACHPDLARRVLTDLRGFDRTGMLYDRLRDAMGNGLATAAHSDHRRQRLIMQPAFAREYLRGYAAVMQQEIAAAMDRWQPGDSVDLVREMFTLTTTVALRILFSTRIGPRETEELRQALDVFLRGIHTRAILPALGLLPTPGNLRYKRALTQWRVQVAALIDGYRRAEQGPEDLMSRLLAARDEEGEGMTDEEVADQVALLMIAGGETTAATVVWSLHLLDRHPAVMAALRAETDAVLDGQVAGWEHLTRLGLTTRVVRESLRLFPPGWAIPRTVAHEITLAGHTVPAGSMVVFSPYVLHRRPGGFTDAADFDPDRWLAGASGSASPHRGSFLPFGAGPTKCIGEEFGLTEAALILASVVARWNVLPDAKTVKPAAKSVLGPTAFPAQLSRR